MVWIVRDQKKKKIQFSHQPTRKKIPLKHALLNMLISKPAVDRVGEIRWGKNTEPKIAGFIAESNFN